MRDKEALSRSTLTGRVLTPRGNEPAEIAQRLAGATRIFSAAADRFEWGEEDIDGLVEFAAAKALVDSAFDRALDALYSQGYYSYGDLARALGVSRQAMREYHQRRVARDPRSGEVGLEKGAAA